MPSDGSPQRQPLQRGEHTFAGAPPMEPSFIFDDSRGTLVATQPISQPVALSASRQRPRFATAQDLDDALLQAIEGKINRKNAWVSKDASNLLEGITHTVESTLDAATATDEYSSFAKVATVVEGCSKVWTSRVDSTYQRSNQMVRRLLRNEEDGGGGSDDEGNDAGGEDLSTAAAAAAERRRKAAQRRAQSARTIALDPSEINLDSKGRMSLVHSGVNAQFRAITEKFDQGNAQGLLLHNTPLGSAGNLILDVDYARETGREYSARRSRYSADLRRVKEELESEEVPVPVTMEEFDSGFDAPLDLPPFPPAGWAASLAGHSPLSGDGADGGGGGVRENDQLSGGGNVRSEEEEAGRPSITLPSLFLLPHTALLTQEGVDNIHGMTAGVQQKQQEGGLYEPGAESSLFPLHQQQPSGYDGDHGDDMDDGDWGGGMDYGDDSMEIGGGGDIDKNDTNSQDFRARVGAEARHLVSGVTELNAIDSCLFGKNRLALEAEDPTSWFPLVEPPTNDLRSGVAHNSELSRLHKEHRFIQTSTQSQVTSATSNKRVKREKTIAFDLPGELAVTAAAAAANGEGGAEGDVDSSSASFSFLLAESGVDSSSLKQSTTVGKNITPLGKELLLGKDPDAILAFTQRAVQRSKAQEAGLLLPESPVPGKTILSFLPYPITVPTFFQPFSTPLMQWNMLRKSATGHTLALSTTGAQSSRRPSGVLANNGWGSKKDDDVLRQLGAGGDDDDADGSGAGAVGVMPVEFFHGGAEADDEFMGAGGYDDYDNDDGDYGNAGDHLRQVEAQIMSSFERPELARRSSALMLPSSGRRSGADELSGMEPTALAKVLHSPQTALPSQVDVVRLRQAMWTSLSSLLKHDTHDQLSSQLSSSGREEQRNTSRKRGRVALEKETDEDEKEKGGGGENLPRFSEVVLPVLPQVPSMSATGTLSPAFFFFSILFLANEHGVLLESVPGLDDLVVRGVNSSATAAPAG